MSNTTKKLAEAMPALMELASEYEQDVFREWIDGEVTEWPPHNVAPASRIFS